MFSIHSNYDLCLNIFFILKVALRYQYQRGNSVVPKSSNKERQKQNIDVSRNV